MSDFEELAKGLEDAGAHVDRLAAWAATGRLVSWLSDLRNRFDSGDLRRLIWRGAINNRWFDIAEVLAGAAAARADSTPDVCRLHAQLLMERGFTEEALARLQPLLSNPNLSDYDRSETLGHIGRINKDRFISAAGGADEKMARSFLEQSINAYLGWYDMHPSATWHGINAVALLSRPEAASVLPGAHDKARALARAIIEQERDNQANSYRTATLAEAYIALGNDEEALNYLREYASDRNVKGFAYNALLRQLTKLWMLDQRPSPGPELVAMIRAALLETEGGILKLTGAEVQRAKAVTTAKLEAVFGSDRFDSFENYRRGLERCACVARIGRSVETGVGTGFVIPGRALCSKLDERFVLVTNAHVISESDQERAEGALHPSEAVVTFAAMDGVLPDEEFSLGKVLLNSPPEQFDVTVAEINPPVSPKAYQLAQLPPARGSDAQVRVVGHPSGRGLSISVNKMLDHQDPKLHYRTATEGGSSGSPVFNQDWKLIGLHHAGGEAVPRLNGEAGTYQANEGIWIRAICKALDQSLP